MLKRRKNKDQMKNYFENVEEGRKKISVEAAKTTVWQKSKETDVLEDWKKAKAKGEIKPLGYEAEPDRKSSLFGNIILPGNPIGMPRMDNGERFDLRLPYAERGYEDPDADVMGKLFSMFSKKTATPAAAASNNNSSPNKTPQVSKPSNTKTPTYTTKTPTTTTTANNNKNKNDSKPQPPSNPKKGWW